MQPVMKLALGMSLAMGGLAQAQFIAGPVNGFRLGGSVLVYGDPSGKQSGVRHVLLTHARRDVVWAAAGPATRGAELIYPERERALIENPGEFWSRFLTARFHDYAQESTKVPVAPLGRGRAVRGGDTLEIGGVRVEVLDTPGYTPGAVSYLFEQGGRRYAATGDLVYGSGQLLDLYSLQHAVPEAKARGYHGYAARTGALIASLRAVAARNPDVLVPARGPLIERPREAIDALIARLQAALASHFTTDALRWYWGDDNLRLRASGALDGRLPEVMEMAEQRSLPEWALAIGNSRLILSRSGAAFLVDAGFRQIVPRLEALRADGRFSRLEGIWITHYHDDHTDRAPEVAARFGAPVHATARMREILEAPATFRLPCLTENSLSRISAEPDGRTVRWHEFELSFFDFPGQTLYHGGLRVRKDGGETVFFVGDSFTPSGLDDYCLQNRNFLRDGTGFVYCLNVLEREAQSAWLVNQHVEPMFRFTPGQFRRMRDEIGRRTASFQELFPWPDLNYGLDESWARIHPYASEAHPGGRVRLEARIFNHSPGAETYQLGWNVPPGWRLLRADRTLKAAPRTEARAAAEFQAGAAGLQVVTLDVSFAGRSLRHWTEAMVTVKQ